MLGIVNLDTGEILMQRDERPTNDVLPLPQRIVLDEDNPRLVAEQALAMYLHAAEEKKKVVVVWDELIAHAKEAAEWALNQLETDKVRAEFGTVYIQRGTTRVNYDARSLDALCKADPDMERVLGEFRKVTELKGQVRFRGRR